MDTHDTSKQHIRPLPEHLINQIKAGEVIERPANLLKELLENALDAYATEIEIQLTDSGLTRMVISDNGVGMSYKDLPWAFRRHATSKIKSYDDLFTLFTYGFRGEALASAASITRIRCITHPKEEGEGGQIILEGGQEISLTPLPYNKEHHGTQLIIEDLFYNTPVRLKFIKSKSAEKALLKKTLWSFLLGWPSVSFTLQWDQGNRQVYPPEKKRGIFGRVEELFQHKGEIYHVEATHNEMGLEAYINVTSTAKQHFLFVNNRFVQDKNLHQRLVYTIEQIFHTPLINYVVFITLPPDRVDVNVHPHKTMVKFDEPTFLYEFIVQSCQKSLKKQAISLPLKETGEEQEEKALLQDLPVGNGWPIKKATLFFSFLKVLHEKAYEGEIYAVLVGECYFVSPLFYENFARAFEERLGVGMALIGANKVIVRSIPKEWGFWPYQKLLGLFMESLQEEEFSTTPIPLEKSFVAFVEREHFTPSELSPLALKTMLDYLGERKKVQALLFEEAHDWYFSPEGPKHYGL